MPKKKVLDLEKHVDKILISVDPKSKFEAKKEEKSICIPNNKPNIIIPYNINESKIQKTEKAKKDVTDIKKHIEEELIPPVKKDTKPNIISQVIPITPDVITSQDISINSDIIKSQVTEKVQSEKDIHDDIIIPQSIDKSTIYINTELEKMRRDIAERRKKTRTTHRSGRKN